MKWIVVFLFFGFFLSLTACNRSSVVFESYQETVNSDLAELDSSDIAFTGTDDQNNVTGDFILPTTSKSGNSITWISSNLGQVTIIDGKAYVNRPGYFEGDAHVTLIGIITVGDASGTKEIVIVVAAVENPREEIAKASNKKAGDNFGISVSISGDYAIVGAYQKDYNSKKTYNNNSGAAYIIERDSIGNWNEKKIFWSDIPGDDHNYGKSVSISGHHAIVGAYHEGGGKINSGSVYFIERDSNGIWNKVQRISHPYADENDEFGYSVSISGDYAIVGAHQEDGIDDGTEDNRGAAYIFERDRSGSWNKVARLWSSDSSGKSFQYFGNSVSISGNFAIVGASQEDSNGACSGAVYFFHRNSSGAWEEVEKKCASNPENGDKFGYSVSINGDYAIVGAHQEDGEGNSIQNCGAAYILRRESAGWKQVALLRASDAQADDEFGQSVSISGDYALVGAHQEDGGEGDPVTDSGAVYIFKRDSSGNWYEDKIVRSSNYGNGDRFGISVSIDESNAIVGANLEDGADDTTEDDSGAVYILY